MKRSDDSDEKQNARFKRQKTEREAWEDIAVCYCLLLLCVAAAYLCSGMEMSGEAKICTCAQHSRRRAVMFA